MPGFRHPWGWPCGAPAFPVSPRIVRPRCRWRQRAPPEERCNVLWEFKVFNNHSAKSSGSEFIRDSCHKKLV